MGLMWIHKKIMYDVFLPNFKVLWVFSAGHFFWNIENFIFDLSYNKKVLAKPNVVVWDAIKLF